MQNTMKTPFINRAINLSSEDVVACEDIIQLKEWLLLLDADIASIGIRISLMGKDPLYDYDKMHKSNTYLSIQKALRKLICGRLHILKTTYSTRRLSEERDFWKAKVQYLAPSRMEEYFLELEIKNAPSLTEKWEKDQLFLIDNA